MPGAPNHIWNCFTFRRLIFFFFYDAIIDKKEGLQKIAVYEKRSLKSFNEIRTATRCPQTFNRTRLDD